MAARPKRLAACEASRQQCALLVCIALGGCSRPATAPQGTGHVIAIAVPAASVPLAPASAPTPRAVAPVPPVVHRTAGAAPPTHVDATGCRVPWDFQLGPMVDVAVPDSASRQRATARILTWLVEVDERPLVIDRALLWVHEHPATHGESWRLVHLYRHPLEETGWHVAVVYDVPYVGQQIYAAAPHRAALDQFLHDTWWKFRASDGFHVLDAEICAQAWTASIGAPPDHLYP